MIIHKEIQSDLSRLAERIAEYTNLSNILLSLEETLEMKFGWDDTRVSAFGNSLYFTNCTLDQMKAISKELGLGVLSKETTQFGQVEFAKRKANINGYEVSVKFTFNLPEACTVKYKTEKKVIDNAKTDKDGQLYVEEEVFDGYDCGDNTMLEKLREVEMAGGVK